MTQLILVYIIIAAAVFYTINSVVKSLKIKSKSGCGNDCGCSAKSDIHKAMKKYRKKQLLVN